jgi:hypothetical protein
VAVNAAEVNIPAPRLNRLMTPGYVALTARGALVTGDGLIRSHQCEQDAKDGARPVSLSR